jgi:uncharacterized protein YdaU (DUF1376 family)
VKGPSPAFSIYPKDVLSDEMCSAMSHEQFGIYMRLLMHAWLEGSIPAEPVKLQRLLKLNAKKFAILWPGIAPCFEHDPASDRLVQRRLERERLSQLDFRNRQSEKGTKSAKSRVFNESVQPRLKSGSTEIQPEVNLPSPSPITEQTDYGLTAVPAVRPAAPSGSLFPPPDAVQSVQAVSVTRVGTTARGVPTSWVGEAGEDWRVQYNAEPKWPRLGKALKPLVDRHGWPTVRQAWLRYLAETEGKYATAERFAETYGHWSGTALPPARAAPASVSERNTETLRNWLHKHQEGDDGP